MGSRSGSPAEPFGPPGQSREGRHNAGHPGRHAQDARGRRPDVYDTPSGRVVSRPGFPGRCPGLDYGGPVGASEEGRSVSANGVVAIRAVRDQPDPSAKGAAIIQPWATPRNHGPATSPALKGRHNAGRPDGHAQDARGRRPDVYDTPSGRVLTWTGFPGRCPGLDYGGPVGATEERHSASANDVVAIRAMHDLPEPNTNGAVAGRPQRDWPEPSAKGAAIIQPGATPRDHDPATSPALKGRHNAGHPDGHAQDARERRADVYAAPSGQILAWTGFPGRCPGLDYGGPVGATEEGRNP